MDVYYDLPYLQEPTAVCLGNFDGVHQGHQLLIQETIKCSRKFNLPSVVMTFEPHPEQLLCPEKRLRRILSNELKTRLIERLGVDILIYLPFTMEIANMSPEKFIGHILKEHCKAVHIFAGFNYTFGKGAVGNTDTLEHFSGLLDYELHVLPPFTVNNTIVSSSLIRSYLEQGYVEKARELLGYNPMLCGKVVHGEGRGRKFGFPTANILVDNSILIPANGVYASLVTLGEKKYWGMTNIGIKPTIGANLPKTIEVNIFDFNGQIYDEILTLEFIKYIRPEKGFPSQEELKKQLARDQRQIRNYLTELANRKCL